MALVNELEKKISQLMTEEEKQNQEITDEELVAEISFIANLDGDHYQKGKYLFHRRLIKNNYIPFSLESELLKKLRSNSFETVLYKDVVNDQKIKVKFCLCEDFVTIITFYRPNSDVGAVLYIFKKQVDLFNNSEENTEALTRLIKKIDRMIHNTQKTKYMPKPENEEDLYIFR